MQDLILIFVALAIGCSAALLAWLLARSAAAVPQEDREFRDPPPPAFRWLWWPIRWVAHLTARWPGRGAQRLKDSLRLAGWEFAVSPAQFMAARWIYASLAGVIVVWLVTTLVRQPLPPSIWVLALIGAMVIGSLMPVVWLHDRVAARRAATVRALPFCLDIITLCVEAGLNLQGAISQAVAKGPAGMLRDELQRVLRDVRAGKARADALRSMAERLHEPAVTQFVGAVVQAEAMGMNLGPVLRAQADQRRTERFLRAEKLAMQAPVKMLLPLIAFIFPCTFIVLFFPIAMKFIHQGV